MHSVHGIHELERGRNPASFKKALGLFPINDREAPIPADFWVWAIPASPGYRLPAYKPGKRAVCDK